MIRQFSSFKSPFLLITLISCSQHAWAVSLSHTQPSLQQNPPTTLTMRASESHELAAFELSPNRRFGQIIYQCLITIIITTWLSTHPNLPGELIWYKRLWRRFKLCAWSLFVPEVILLWSIRQMYAARKYALKYKDQGWTTSHGHFLQMGGFVIRDAVASQGGDVIRALSPPEFDALISSSLISFPLLSYRALRDKSKTHPLATLLGALQSLWFISNCIARADQGLGLTKPEIVTLGIVLLNIAIYFVWWNKPLNVSHPVQVYPKPLSEAPRGTLKLEAVTEEEDVRSRGYSTDHHPSDTDLSSSSNTPSSKTKNTLITIISVLFFPITILVKVGSWMVHILDLPSSSSNPSPPYDQFHTRQVPLFYTAPLPLPRPFISAFLFGLSAYGSLHCITSFTLPSPTSIETLLWKISTLCITALPLSLISLSLLRPAIEAAILFIKRRGWRVPQRPKKVKKVVDKDLEGLFDEPGHISFGKENEREMKVKDKTKTKTKSIPSKIPNNNNKNTNNTTSPNPSSYPTTPTIIVSSPTTNLQTSPKISSPNPNSNSTSNNPTSSTPSLPLSLTPSPGIPHPTRLSRSSIPYRLLSCLSTLITYTAVSVYLIARMYIFVEAFVSLRAVPGSSATSGVLVDARGWTRFIPHL